MYPTGLLLFISLIVTIALHAIPDQYIVYWDGQTLSNHQRGVRFELPRDKEAFFSTVSVDQLLYPGNLYTYSWIETYCQFATIKEQQPPEVLTQIRNHLLQMTLHDLPGHWHPVFYGIVSNEIFTFHEECLANPAISWWDVEKGMEYDSVEQKMGIINSLVPTKNIPLALQYLQEGQKSQWEHPRLLRFRIGQYNERSQTYPVHFWFTHQGFHWLTVLHIPPSTDFSAE